jgi:hypothetical protein
LNEISFPEFRIITTNHLQTYLSKIWAGINNGSIQTPSGIARLFPAMIVFTETPTHYVFELFGARRAYKELKSKRHVTESLDLLLGDFNYDGPTRSFISFEKVDPPSADRSPFSDIALVHERTLSQLDNRFPGVSSLFDTRFMFAPTDGDVKCIKSFDASNLRHSLVVNKCLIVNSLDALVRARYTNLLFAVPRGVLASEFRRVLNDTIPSALDPQIGIQVVRPGDQEGIAQASQFSNLYLQGAQETTLTQFLEDHADIAKKALKADEVFFQPKFPWREGNPDPEEKEIQPDMIVRRADGSWWIVDFKLPLLNDSSITTGGHRRRRFVYTVGDGIAQLHNYHEYFDYESNRDIAALTLGEKIKDPRLMLIVGTTENVDLTEVEEAKRALKTIDIVDYDTLIHLSLANNTVLSHSRLGVGRVRPRHRPYRLSQGQAHESRGRADWISAEM